jgi:NAD(P)-dependent dehydrogenase (short-subunit alcohol dehydrogenase family)
MPEPPASGLDCNDKSKDEGEKMMTMQGKICLVTGGTNGIGKSTALALARMGATVVIVGRDAQKTAQVVQEIRSATGNERVNSLLADLSSQQDIRRLANEFKSKYSHLHVLLNNAGGFFMRRQLSVDGIEMTFALNHLAYFLLTNLLLDTIKASGAARIINVSSDAHAGGKIAFDNLQGEREYSASAYGNSKLANILFTMELSSRLEGTGVTVNALHPGFVSTGFGKNNPGLLMKAIRAVVPLIARSPEKGAKTSIYLASSPAVADSTGKYFFDSQAIPAAVQATDMITAKKLWEVSAKMVQM